RRQLVADELLLRLRVQLLPPGAQLVGRELETRGATVRARTLTLLLERALEPLDVDRVPALAGDQLRQVQGEAVGVVEAERVGARDRRARHRARVDRRTLLRRKGRRDLVDPLHPRV